MKDEIKEILGSMSEYLEEKKKDYEEIVIKNGFPGDSIVYEVYYEDIKTLLDYITNLQEKVNQYENPDDLTLFYMWLDVKAKDKMKQLQEENERLKFYLKVKSKEYDNLEKATKLIGDYKDDLESDYENYKSRNEKAINILELSSQNKSMCTRPETDTIQSALNILKGGISKYE